MRSAEGGGKSIRRQRFAHDLQRPIIGDGGNYSTLMYSVLFVGAQKIMSIYPLFVPPKELYEIPKEGWKLTQAKQFFSWLMSERSSRVHVLLRHLKIDEMDFSVPRDMLENAVTKSIELFKSNVFSSQNELTNYGYALAADLGLLLVACLEKEFNFIQWEIRKKPKTDINYLTPCYYIPNEYSTDPVFVSTSCAYSVINNSKGIEKWMNWYDDVRAKAINFQKQRGRSTLAFE